MSATADVDDDIRCAGKWSPRNKEPRQCGRKLALSAGRPWIIRCPRCKFVNASHGPKDPGLTQDRAGV